jgi:hypothetical protein
MVDTVGVILNGLGADHLPRASEATHKPLFVNEDGYTKIHWNSIRWAVVLYFLPPPANFDPCHSTFTPLY